jgi:hypothetical protein
MSWFLMVVGAAAVAFGLWKRLRHAQSPAEHAPTGRGTSPGPLFKVTDIVVIIGGAMIFILGAVTYYYAQSYAPLREPHRGGPPAAQTGALELPEPDTSAG